MTLAGSSSKANKMLPGLERGNVGSVIELSPKKGKMHNGTKLTSCKS
jgi:hypothetical protein